jgi:hypothetical protein
MNDTSDKALRASKDCDIRTDAVIEAQKRWPDLRDPDQSRVRSAFMAGVNFILASGTPETGTGGLAEALRKEAATVKLGECMPAGRFPEGVSRYNALMWAAELIEERSPLKAGAVHPGEVTAHANWQCVNCQQINPATIDACRGCMAPYQ